MTARARIESLGVALPARRMTMEEVEAGCRVRIDYPLSTWTGIQAHRRAGEDEFAFDLARRAVETCFSRSRYDPSDIGLVINCNISRVDGPGRFSHEPATANRLAARFGLHHALTFDITNACAGMFTGLSLAADFLATGRVRCALIVSGEYITHLTDTAQREIKGHDDPALPCLTLGDAGAALIVDATGPGENIGFEVIDMLTLGRYCRLCVSTPTFQPGGGALMRTDSVRLGSVGTREGIRHMQYVLERLGSRPRDFQHLIPHQTSLATLTSATRAANAVFGEGEMHEGSVVVNLAERGNTASTTHFVALWDGIHAGRIRSGDRILFTTVASGLVVGIGAYTLDDLPERLLAESPPAKPTRDHAEPSPAGATWSAPGSASPRIRFESIGIAGASCKRDTLALCQAAGEAAFKGSAYGRKDFSDLIFTGIHRTDWITEPAIASFVAGELRMNEAWTSPGRSTFAFDLTQGATGFLTACEVARQRLARRPEQPILIVSAELDPNMKTRPDLPLGIETSGAAVVLDVSPDPARGLGSIVFRRFPERVDTMVSDLYFGDPVVHQVSSGREVAFPFLLEWIPDTVSELLRVEGITLDDVKAVFLPEPAPGFRQRAGDLLRLEPGRIIDPPEERVDRHTCSLPYLLHRARLDGRVSEGDVGLLVELGSGLQVACAVYRF